MKTQILASLFPLVLFWAVEEFYGLKAALVVGCVAAVLEVSWEYWKTKTVSKLTLFSNALVLVMGAISYVMDSGLAFKLQPVVMEWVMAGVLWTMSRRGKPLMVEMFEKNPMLAPEKREAVMKNPLFLQKLTRVDSRLFWFFLIHGIALAVAAVFFSTRVWILLKGVLFYVLLMLVAIPR